MIYIYLRTEANIRCVREYDSIIAIPTVHCNEFVKLELLYII